ncbi:MAG: cytochrome c3 family protein, partial [ANME-2 cluster archaeon]
MNKSQLFALLIVITLGLIIASIIYYDSDASIEMQQCGGCHNPEYTQKMAGAGIWPAVFNTIVLDQRGERAVPCTEGYIRGCIECHSPAHGVMQLHVGMTSSECSRCHTMPIAPMYTECTMCHGDYQHADPEMTGDCMSCHPAHTADTSAGCGDCHT